MARKPLPSKLKLDDMPLELPLVCLLVSNVFHYIPDRLWPLVAGGFPDLNGAQPGSGGA
ncbi:hypothetical protein PtB15_16B413 [Puccinia triticina]|nr:hypothetical protein PtB15_16B413 [Puccinia triticina]